MKMMSFIGNVFHCGYLSKNFLKLLMMFSFISKKGFLVKQSNVNLQFSLYCLISEEKVPQSSGSGPGVRVLLEGPGSIFLGISTKYASSNFFLRAFYVSHTTSNDKYGCTCIKQATQYWKEVVIIFFVKCFLLQNLFKFQLNIKICSI